MELQFVEIPTASYFLSLIPVTVVQMSGDYHAHRRHTFLLWKQPVCKQLMFSCRKNQATFEAQITLFSHFSIDILADILYFRQL